MSRSSRNVRFRGYLRSKFGRKKNREDFAFPMPAPHPQTIGMSVVEKARDLDGRVGSGWYQDFFFGTSRYLNNIGTIQTIQIGVSEELTISYIKNKKVSSPFIYISLNNVFFIL
jgi:hypothetical protein